MPSAKQERIEFLEAEIRFLKKVEFFTTRAMNRGDDGTMKNQLERTQKERDVLESELLVLKPIAKGKRRAKVRSK